MCDGLLCRIDIAKHPTELFQPSTAPVHSAAYHAGPGTREFEKAKIDKMLAENLIEPAQTE